MTTQKQLNDLRLNLKFWEDLPPRHGVPTSERLRLQYAKTCREELEAFKATMTTAEKIHDLELQIPKHDSPFTKDLILEEIDHLRSL